MFEQPSRYTRRVLQIGGRFSSKASIFIVQEREAVPLRPPNHRAAQVLQGEQLSK